MKKTRLLTRPFIITQAGSLPSFTVDPLQECERTSLGGKLGANLFRVANPRLYMGVLARACTGFQHTHTAAPSYHPTAHNQSNDLGSLD
jgi:hypothetical protein